MEKAVGHINWAEQICTIYSTSEKEKAEIEIVAFPAFFLIIHALLHIAFVQHNLQWCMQMTYLND